MFYIAYYRKVVTKTFYYRFAVCQEDNRSVVYIHRNKQIWGEIFVETLVNLKQFRQNLKISQATAAEGIGIDQRQWNRYENGINELPVRYLKAICTTYGVSADTLLNLNIGNVNFTKGGRDMDKFAKLFDEVIDIINWAVEQHHINDDAATVLIRNIGSAKDEIENEN